MRFIHTSVTWHSLVKAVLCFGSRRSSVPPTICQFQGSRCPRIYSCIHKDGERLGSWRLDDLHQWQDHQDQWHFDQLHLFFQRRAGYLLCPLYRSSSEAIVWTLVQKFRTCQRASHESLSAQAIWASCEFVVAIFPWTSASKTSAPALTQAGVKKGLRPSPTAKPAMPAMPAMPFQIVTACDTAAIGILKVMSKMGISCLQSYKAAVSWVSCAVSLEPETLRAWLIGDACIYESQIFVFHSPTK